MLKRVLIFLVLMVLCSPTLRPARPPSPLVPGLEAYVAFLDRLLATDRPAVLAAVDALEAGSLPPGEGRDQLYEGLYGLFTARGEPALAARIARLPALPQAPRKRTVSPLSFPKDHGSHGLGDFMEWWYFSGNLAADGRRYGYELTFFKTSPGVHFLHAAISDVAGRRHPFLRRWVTPRNATFEKSRLGVSMFDAFAREGARGAIELKFQVEGHTVALTLTPERAPMIVNGNGVIDMPEGTTSRYYSFTRMASTGTLTTPDGRRHALAGRSWFDHQWGNFVALFRPWDWFSFQLDDGTDYNLFHFRQKAGFAGRTDVNVLHPDGRLESTKDLTLARREWWQSPRTRDHFVMRWLLARRTQGGGHESFDVTTPLADQEMPRAFWADFPPAYWEGAIDVLRVGADGRTVRGVGYSEHMPYARPQ